MPNTTSLLRRLTCGRLSPSLSRRSRQGLQVLTCGRLSPSLSRRSRQGLQVLTCGALMILSLLMLMGCDEMKKASLIYADGSGNIYRVTPAPEATIAYEPVKPANSSSGTYDGGEPYTGPLKPADHERILGALRAAVLNRKVHIADRVMMSGAITIRQGEQETNFILRPGCAEQKNLEAALKDALR